MQSTLTAKPHAPGLHDNMKIELKEITVRELADGYKDSQESGVVAFGGKL
ncbi:MAG: hypothetical protein AB7W44_18900 [Pyrinomonadaceae bacterium]